MGKLHIFICGYSQGCRGNRISISYTDILVPMSYTDILHNTASHSAKKFPCAVEFDIADSLLIYLIILIEV